MSEKTYLNAQTTELMEGSASSTQESDGLVIEKSSGVRRGLKTRHITLIALGGIIGPGAIASIGTILNEGGAATLVIDFALLGLIGFAVMQSVGELSSIYPQTIVQQASRFVDESFGACIGYNYLIAWIAVLASEYNTLSSTLRFWGPQVPEYGYFLMLWCFFMGLQFLGSSGYGEIEYWLALGKVAGISAYYIFTVVYMSGGIKGTPAFGFHNFKTPWGPHTAIKSLATVFAFASTEYLGIEMVTVAAAETKNPPKAIPIAIRQTVFRILYVYLFLMFSYGITVPYNSPQFSESSGALKSPMTIAITNAGWAGSKHLINAFIVFVAISAINSCIYIGSRTMVNLAAEGMLPFSKFLRKTNKRGVPWVSSIIFNLFGFLCLMNMKTGAKTAFSYLINISGVPVFIVWAGISYTHIRFRQGWVASGRKAEELPYRSMLYPIVPLFSIFMNVFLLLVQGWMYFKPFDYKMFVDSYICVAMAPVFFFGFKLIKKTKWVKFEDMDFETGRRKDLEEVLRISREETENQNLTRKQKIIELFKTAF